MSFIGACKKGKEKAKNFYANHKTGVKIGIAALGTAAVWCIAYAVGKAKGADDFEKEYNYIAWSKKIDDDGPIKEEVIEALDYAKDEINNKSESDNDNSIPWECRKWKEEYREVYDKVNEFANTIDLEDGEMYIIERNSEFDDYRKEHNLPTNIVSHMIDGDGVYPPDERDE